MNSSTKKETLWRYIKQKHGNNLWSQKETSRKTSQTPETPSPGGGGGWRKGNPIKKWRGAEIFKRATWNITRKPASLPLPDVLHQLSTVFIRLWNRFVNPVERQRDNHAVFQKQREIKARGWNDLTVIWLSPSFGDTRIPSTRIPSVLGYPKLWKRWTVANENIQKILLSSWLTESVEQATGNNILIKSKFYPIYFLLLLRINVFTSYSTHRMYCRVHTHNCWDRGLQLTYVYRSKAIWYWWHRIFITGVSLQRVFFPFSEQRTNQTKQIRRLLHPFFPTSSFNNMGFYTKFFVLALALVASQDCVDACGGCGPCKYPSVLFLFFFYFFFF